MFVALSLFGGCGAALLFMSARITGDDNRLTVQRLQNEVSVAWPSIIKARVGGGNLVLYTKEGRLSLPSFEFWSGREKMQLMNLMAIKFHQQEVSLGPSARAIFHAADR